MGCCGGAEESPEAERERAEEKKTEQIEKIDVVGSYKFGRTLGSGASCRVVQATNKDDAQIQVAIKIMDKERSITKKLYHREVNILEKLTPDIKQPHKGILPFMGHGEDNDSYYIVTRLLYGGELFDRIVSKEEEYKITEKIAVKLVCDMLEAVKYCHDNNIVHRDLKPENFVFASKRVDSDIVLIDYGCARIVKDEEEIEDVVGMFCVYCLLYAIMRTANQRIYLYIYIYIEYVFIYRHSILFSTRISSSSIRKLSKERSKSIR